MAQDAINENLQKLALSRILVVGDVMLDVYTHGQVSRISPEAPIQVFKLEREEFFLGGAANVAASLSALGCQVELFGLIGADSDGGKIQQLLKTANIQSSGLIPSNSRLTTRKNRFASGNLPLLRVDNETVHPISSHEADALFIKVHKSIAQCDAIILSDYAKGIFTLDLATKIIKIAQAHNVQVFADFKPQNKEFFKGADVISPNLEEGQKMTEEKSPGIVALKLREFFNCAVVLTLGANGIYVLPKEGAGEYISAVQVLAFSVVGAGDTVIAILAAAMASGFTLKKASRLANNAAAIAIQKTGTSTVSISELRKVNSTQNINKLQVVPKVWGHEKWLQSDQKYCFKILSIKKGYQSSLHYHKIKDETFLVKRGSIYIDLGREFSLQMGPGDFLRIEPGTVHRFGSTHGAEILEVSTTHEESDSYRLEPSRRIT